MIGTAGAPAHGGRWPGLSASEAESLVYAVGHDFRAPLRAIHGFSRMLGDSAGAALTTEQAHHLETIRGSADELGRMVDGLLAYLRVAAQPISPVELDVAVIAGAIAERLVARGGPPDLEIHIDPMPRVVADPGLLEVALEHLIGNAVRFSRDQSPAIVEVGADEPAAGDPPDTPTFRVRDNGVGFDPARAGRLFGLFQRLGQLDERDHVGIGLACTRRIIDGHGGRIWATAAPNAGATFAFTLAPSSSQ